MLYKWHKLPMLIMIVSILNIGCVSTAESPTPPSATDTSDSDSVSINQQQKIEQPSQPELQTDVESYKSQKQLEEVNEQITFLAANATNDSANVDRFSYSLGPGDVIDIAVFQVSELNRKARISGDGYIMVPLIGEVYAEGLTTSQLEDELRTKLAENYLHNPQVSVFIEEFRSHQVSVSGAVNQPNIYEIQRAQNVLEMLAMAGGLSPDAGPQVYVTRFVMNEESGSKERVSTVIKLDTLLTSNDPRLNILLRAGDSINVPKAGVVFVEGAVNSPGAYQIKGDMNVLKAIAVAGDIKFEAKRGNIQIFRETNGATELIEVDLDAIKSRTIDDVTLYDGDIIVVPDNKFKKGWSGFWKGISGIFSVGTRI